MNSPLQLSSVIQSQTDSSLHVKSADEMEMKKFQL